MKSSIKTIVTAVLATTFFTGCSILDRQVNEALEQESIYDTTRPALSQWMTGPSILVFSKTKSFRHDAGIAGADKFFADLAEERGYGLFTTVNSAVFNAEDLSRFNIVIFNNMSGDALSPEQETVFQEWLEAGGAWIGLHASGDNSQKDWHWYMERLIGPDFIGHPSHPQHLQNARLVQLAASHPVLNGLPPEWNMKDEWYSFDDVPQSFGLTPLVGIDETTYKPLNSANPANSDLSMGNEPIEHPMVWSSCVGEGRSLYSAIGHTQHVYDNAHYRKLLENAFDWTLKLGGFESPAGCE